MNKADIDALICNWSMETETPLTKRALDLLVDRIADVFQVPDEDKVKPIGGQPATVAAMLDGFRADLVQQKRGIFIGFGGDDLPRLWATEVSMEQLALAATAVQRHAIIRLDNEVEDG